MGLQALAAFKDLIPISLILDAPHHEHARPLAAVDRLAALDEFRLVLRAYGVSDFRTRPIASVRQNEMAADVHALAIDADDHASRQAIVKAAARWPVFPHLVEGRPFFAAGGPLPPLDTAPRPRFALTKPEI